MFHFISPPMPHHIIMGEDTYPVGGRHPDRSGIGVFDLLVVTRGALYIEENNQKYTADEGSYLILRPDMAHRSYMPCTEETHFYWLHFQTLGAFNETSDSPPYVHFRSHENRPFAQIEEFSFYISHHGKLPVPDRAVEKLKEMLSLQDEETSAVRWKQQTMLQSLLLLLQEDSQLTSLNPQIVLAEKTAAYLRKHYKESVSYRQLTEVLHFHANYIANCMKRTYGCTPLEYLIRYRVEQAKQLLIRSNEPIGSIADMTGFGSFPYFVRCFKKYAGCNPKTFRQQFRQ